VIEKQQKHGTDHRNNETVDVEPIDARGAQARKDMVSPECLVKELIANGRASAFIAQNEQSKTARAVR
jgi:hypothetical protein